MSSQPIETRSPQAAAVLEYYRRIDAGDFAAELFSPHFQFYFPKYGVGHGPAQFLEMSGGLMKTTVRQARHHLDQMLIFEQGNKVAVEGTTEGVHLDGTVWHGGRTAGGRFCSIFSFGPDGLIDRMHVYLDPDYTSRDQARFVWAERSSQEW